MTKDVCDLYFGTAYVCIHLRIIVNIVNAVYTKVSLIVWRIHYIFFSFGSAAVR